MALPERTIVAVTEGPDHVHGGHGGTSFDGPAAVDLFRLVVIARGLHFEIKTGMKMRAGLSMLKAANDALGTNYRRKQQAYDHLQSLLQAYDLLQSMLDPSR